MGWQRASSCPVGPHTHRHMLFSMPNIKKIIGCLLFNLSMMLFLSAGIMSILFAGIVMSHYTHHNLSPVTQILMQQTLRTVAFMCGRWFYLYLPVTSVVSFLNSFFFLSPETCVFAFLGLSIFSFPHNFEISFVIWCIVSGLVHYHIIDFHSTKLISAAVLSVGPCPSRPCSQHFPSVIPAQLF